MDSVTSADGTRIAFDRSGDGPPLILVAGALSTRAGASDIAALLAASFTTVAYDRRGRGTAATRRRMRLSGRSRTSRP